MEFLSVKTLVLTPGMREEINQHRRLPEAKIDIARRRRLRKNYHSLEEVLLVMLRIPRLNLHPVALLCSLRLLRRRATLLDPNNSHLAILLKSRNLPGIRTPSLPQTRISPHPLVQPVYRRRHHRPLRRT